MHQQVEVPQEGSGEGTMWKSLEGMSSSAISLLGNLREEGWLKKSWILFVPVLPLRSFDAKFYVLFSIWHCERTLG